MWWGEGRAGGCGGVGGWEWVGVKVRGGGVGVRGSGSGSEGEGCHMTCEHFWVLDVCRLLLDPHSSSQRPIFIQCTLVAPSATCKPCTCALYFFQHKLPLGEDALYTSSQHNSSVVRTGSHASLSTSTNRHLPVQYIGDLHLHQTTCMHCVSCLQSTCRRYRM